MCCKATLLPPDAYGPKAPEGSEEFRFRTIALKPAFILSQLKTTQQALTLALALAVALTLTLTRILTLTLTQTLGWHC